MSYFIKFPLMTYDIKGNKIRKLLPDILRRVKLRASIKSGGMLFDKYDVKEGEKPEDVAFKWFGDPELHWVILMTNNVTDRYYDWPMNQVQFAEYLTDKYGQILTQYIITKSQKIVVVQQVKDRVITHIRLRLIQTQTMPLSYQIESMKKENKIKKDRFSY